MSFIAGPVLDSNPLTVQILKFPNRRGIPDQARRRRRSHPAPLRRDAQGLRILGEVALVVATYALNRDCHSVTSEMSLATVGEAIIGPHVLHRRDRSAEGMGIGRGTGHRSGMIDASGDALGHPLHGTGGTEAQARGVVARTTASQICRYRGVLQEMCRKCKFLSLRRLTGMHFKRCHPVFHTNAFLGTSYSTSKIPSAIGAFGWTFWCWARGFH